MKHRLNTIKTLFIILFLFPNLTLFAQIPDKYNIILDGNWVTNSTSDADFQSHGIKVKLLSNPLDSGRRGILGVSADYKYVEVNFKNKQEFMSELKHFHSIGVSVGYVKQIKKTKWSFVGIVNPLLSSNFTNGINGDDFQLNATALFNYSLQKNSRISVGLIYASTLGYPAPLPMVNYWKAWNEKWEMNCGFPRVNVTYHFNTKTSLSGFSELKGFNGNLSKNLVDPEFKRNRTAENVSYRDILAGMECQYKFKNVKITFNASYTINRSFELENSDKQVAYKFDMNNDFNVGVGMAFSL